MFKYCILLAILLSYGCSSGSSTGGTPTCNQNSECSGTQVCVNRSCQAQTADHCKDNTACMVNNVQKGTCGANGTCQCGSSADCTGTLNCVSGVCECATASDCPHSTQACINSNVLLMALEPPIWLLEIA